MTEAAGRSVKALWVLVFMFGLVTCGLGGLLAATRWSLASAKQNLAALESQMQELCEQVGPQADGAPSLNSVGVAGEGYVEASLRAMGVVRHTNDSIGDRLSKNERCLNELERRIGQVDGKNQQGSTAYGGYGRGAIGNVESRLDDIDEKIQQLEKTIRNLNIQARYQ